MSHQYCTLFWFPKNRSFLPKNSIFNPSAIYGMLAKKTSGCILVLSRLKERMANKKPTIRKNFVYNLLYQVFLVIIPVVTTPYLARVLHSDGIGQFSFSYSIASYFLLLGNLGFSYYAQREISKCQDDKHKQSCIFWEICIIRFGATIIAGCGLIVLSLFPYFSDYRFLLQLLSILVFANAIDPSFVFLGNENFKELTIRNIIVKSLMVASVFIFVRFESDLWKYCLIQGLNPFVSALIMIPFLRNYLVKVKREELSPWKHVVPSLRLFVPTIAISVYTMLDKTMIGLLVQGEITVIEDGTEVVKKIADIESGYYNQAEKIVKLLLTIVAALGGVLVPRNAYLYANGKEKEADLNVQKGFSVAFFLAVPLSLGLIAISDNFCPWFFGPGYEKVPLLMRILAGLILAIGFNNVYGPQHLIPSGKDRQYTIAVVAGAAINFGLNIVLVYFYASIGAAIASVVAEAAILIIMAFMCRKRFSIPRILLSGWKNIVAGIIMFLPCFSMGLFLPSSPIYTILIVFVGFVTYIGMLALLKDHFFLSFIRSAAKRFIKPKTRSDQESPNDEH